MTGSVYLRCALTALSISQRFFPLPRITVPAVRKDETQVGATAPTPPYGGGLRPPHPPLWWGLAPPHPHIVGLEASLLPINVY